MPQKTHHYSNGEITLYGNPKYAFIQEFALRGLPEFLTHAENHGSIMSNAETQQIIEQVKKCPSGALSIANQN